MIDATEQAGMAQAAASNTDVSRETSGETPTGDVAMPADSGPISAVDTVNMTEASLDMVNKDKAALQATLEQAQEKLYAGKYSSIEDLESGYVNLYKKMGAFEGAPDAYTLDNVNTPESNVRFDAESPMMKMAEDFAKTSNMPQKTFDGLLDIYRQIRVGEAEANAKEWKALGTEGDKIKQDVSNFASNYLPEDQAGLVHALCKDQFADKRMIVLLNAFSKAAEPVEGPTELRMAPQKSAIDTVQRVQQEITDNYQKYKTDKNYRTDTFERLKKAQEAVDRSFITAN